MINNKNIEALHNDIKDNKITVKLNMNMIIVGALSILVFVSVIQTVTLASLVNRKPAASDNNAQTTSSQTGGGGNTTLPAALKEVPQQVSGC